MPIPSLTDTIATSAARNDEATVFAIKLNRFAGRLSISERSAPITIATIASIMLPLKNSVNAPTVTAEARVMTHEGYGRRFLVSHTFSSKASSGGLVVHISRERALRLSSILRFVEVLFTLRSCEEYEPSGILIAALITEIIVNTSTCAAPYAWHIRSIVSSTRRISPPLRSIPSPTSSARHKR